MISLKGKTILLTGGGAGIGLGILRQCVAAGAKVVVLELNGALRQTVLDEHGVFIQVDVGDAQALVSVLREVVRDYKIDGLVNNAGITIQKPLAEMTIDEMDLLWRVNQRAYLLTVKTLSSQMAENAGGAIVNIASNHARASDKDYETYAGTKGAIVAMTRAMAWSLGPKNIRVNALAPGLTMTEAVKNVAADKSGLMDRFNSWHATGRTNTVDEIGKVAVYLLSDASVALTGSEIIADQGMSARLGAIE